MYKYSFEVQLWIQLDRVNDLFWYFELEIYYCKYYRRCILNLRARILIKNVITYSLVTFRIQMGFS